MHDHPNDNLPNTKIKNLYGNVIMNWTIHHGTLKFSLPHMNSVLVETWEAFKIPSATITQKAFKKTHLPPLYPADIGTNQQDHLAGIQLSNRDKDDDIGCIEKASIANIQMEEVRKTDPMVILREKGRCRSSRNLLIREAAHVTVKARTVLPPH